jgi:hypothetical protein
MAEFDVTTSNNPAQMEVGNDGSVTLTVSNLSKNANAKCKMIQIDFYKGDTSESLFSNDAAHKIDISTNSRDWETEKQREKEEKPDTHSYILTNKKCGALTEPLVITITGKVSNVCGNAELEIWINDDEEEYHQYLFTKHSAEFYLRNFITRLGKKESDLSSSNIPKTRFDKKQPVLFTWESNGSAFRIYDGYNESTLYDSADKPNIPITSFTLQDGIVRDTTFVLIAEKQEVKTTHQLIDHITLIASEPEIEKISADRIEVNNRFIAKEIEVKEKMTADRIESKNIMANEEIKANDINAVKSIHSPYIHADKIDVYKRLWSKNQFCSHSNSIFTGQINFDVATLKIKSKIEFDGDATFKRLAIFDNRAEFNSVLNSNAAAYMEGSVWCKDLVRVPKSKIVYDN